MNIQTQLLLLSDNLSHIERTMRAWLEKSCRFPVFLHSLPPEPNDPEQFPAWVVETFAEIAAWIEERARGAGGLSALRDCAAYIEAFDPEVCGWEDFKPLDNSQAPRLALVWMLVLAFPEIHWIFYSPYSAPTAYRLSNAHFLLPSNGMETVVQLHRAGFVSLFDPDGVRELMHDGLRQETIGKPGLFTQLPKRSATAVALDEELDYAFFTAYLAYRLGYRTWLISSMELMKFRLSQQETPALSLEDLFLAFPDRSYVKESLSDLKERYRAFPALADVSHRVVITVGRETAEAGGVSVTGNREFLKQLGHSFRILYKPLTGIFETAHQADIRKALNWPPREHRRESSEPHGHSAPGRALAVANALLSRSQSLLNSTPTVQDAIHAAVLALDAKELLGGRTPTLALRAIALQHEAEVAAESLFLGVQHNLDVRQRLEDIRSEVEFCSKWVHPSQRTRSVLNARLFIAEQLAKRYRDRNQIEEEAACLAEARKLRFDFWVRERSLRWLFWPFLRYIAFSLSSISRFIAVVVGWTVFFGASYYFLGLVAHKPSLGFWDAAISSTRLFFSGNAAADWETLRQGYGWAVLWKGWITFQSIVSFANLGLLLSHLYMLVSRR